MRLCICLLVGLSLLMGVTCLGAAPAVNYHQVRKITVGGDGGWDYLTLDGAANRLYVARSNRVTVIDVSKDVVLGEVANTPGVHGVALVTKLGHGYASAGRDDSVVVFPLTPAVDAKSGKLDYKEITRIHVGTRPDAIIYDPAVNRVFTMNGGSHDATAIDVATNKVVGTVPLGGKPEFAVVDQKKGQIFVNIEDTNEIVSFDPKTLKVNNRWPIAPGTGPSGLAMDQKNRRLFSVCDNEMMVVVNADTGKVIATPKIGQGPDAARFDRKLGLAFSSNGEGTLTVIKEESKDKFTVLANVPTQNSARTMELDPKTHLIYLAAASVKKGTRQADPGSFVILVYGP